MSSHPKAAFKATKAKQKKEQKPETPDDYQALGVDLEDAAGKWRAGDAVKSMRFFQRAIEIYDQGLSRFPDSLDLAYNKARVQLEIATHPILVQQLQVPVLDALKTALSSHQTAISLDEDNADTLFNTSQVLTGIAEALAGDNDQNDMEALQYLEQAFELQNRCLGIQEIKYQESIEQERAVQSQTWRGNAANSDDEGGGAAVQQHEASTPEDQWFTVVEPVTIDVLIDTVLVQLNILTMVCGIICALSDSAPPNLLPWAEKQSSKLLGGKLPEYMKHVSRLTLDPPRLTEIALSRANLLASLAEACYRMGRLDLDSFKRERDAAFAGPELSQPTNIDSLLANAESLIAFSIAAAQALNTTAHARNHSLRWLSLSNAATHLSTAAKLPDITTDVLAKTHTLRGDASLLQYAMSIPPSSYPTAIANSTQLLKNAEVFYRNASKLFSTEIDRQEALLRFAVAKRLQNDSVDLLALIGKGKDDPWVQSEIEHLVTSGFITGDFSFD